MPATPIPRAKPRGIAAKYIESHFWTNGGKSDGDGVVDGDGDGDGDGDMGRTRTERFSVGAMRSIMGYEIVKRRAIIKRWDWIC